MQVRPLSDRVLVERLEEERKTAGGIIIPDSNTEKPSEGKIVSVGPGRTLDNGSVFNYRRCRNDGYSFV